MFFLFNSRSSFSEVNRNVEDLVFFDIRPILIPDSWNAVWFLFLCDKIEEATRFLRFLVYALSGFAISCIDGLDEGHISVKDVNDFDFPL